MRKIISFILFMVACHMDSGLMAQLPPTLDCNHNNVLTTDWRATDQLPAAGNQVFQTFDWTAEFLPDLYIDGTNRSTNQTYPQPTQNVRSPFYKNALSATFQQNNVGEFQVIEDLRGIANVDCHPEDGWELLHKDFGLPSAKVSNPFFALYHKYKGVIRVFVLITSPNAAGFADGAKVSLDHKDTGMKTGILGLSVNVGQALDNFDGKRVISVPNGYTNTMDYWLYAEIPVAYDPCVCKFATEDNPPRIGFTPYIVQQGTIQLTGTSNGTQIPFNLGTGSGLLLETDQNGNRSLGANRGFRTFNHMNSAAQDMRALQNTGSSSIFSDRYFKMWTSLATGVISTSMKPTDIFKQVVGMSEFLIALTEEDKPVSRQEASPLAYFSNTNINLTGSWTTYANNGGKYFFAPGTIAGNSTTNPTIPAYNNPLGVFNILESPKVEYAEYNYDTRGSNFGAPKLREYRLTAPPKFMINPITGYEAIDVKVALEYQQKTLPDVVDITNHANAPLSYPNSGTYRTMRGPVEWGVTRYERESQPFAEHMAGAGIYTANWPSNTNKLKDITFSTEPMDITCLRLMPSFWIFYNGPVDEPEVHMRIKVLLRRVGSANPNDTKELLLFLKYKAEPTQRTTTTPLQWAEYDVTAAPYPSGTAGQPVQYALTPNRYITYIPSSGPSRVVRDVELSPSPLGASMLNSFSQTFGNIRITPQTLQYYTSRPASVPKVIYGTKISIDGNGGNLVLPQGWTYIASQDIDVDPIVDISTSEFIISKNTQCSDYDVTLLQATIEDMNTLCSSVRYRDVATKNVEVELPSPKKEEISGLYITPFPNPASDILSLKIGIPAKGTYTLNITSILGESIATLPQLNDIEIGEYTSFGDISMLPSGVYIITIQGEATKESVKFVKQ